MESPRTVITEDQEMDIVRQGLASYMQFVSQRGIVTTELLASMRRPGGAFNAAVAIDKMFNPCTYQVQIPVHATARSLIDAARAEHDCRPPLVVHEGGLSDFLDSALDRVRGKLIDILLYDLGAQQCLPDAWAWLAERGYLGNVASAFVWIAYNRPLFDCEAFMHTSQTCPVALHYRHKTDKFDLNGANLFVSPVHSASGVLIGSRVIG